MSRTRISGTSRMKRNTWYTKFAAWTKMQKNSVCFHAGFILTIFGVLRCDFSRNLSLETSKLWSGHEFWSRVWSVTTLLGHEFIWSRVWFSKCHELYKMSRVPTHSLRWLFLAIFWLLLGKTCWPFWPIFWPWRSWCHGDLDVISHAHEQSCQSSKVLRARNKS